jgi:hypothetical protein
MGKPGVADPNRITDEHSKRVKTNALLTFLMGFCKGAERCGQVVKIPDALDEAYEHTGISPDEVNENTVMSRLSEWRNA